MLGTRKAQAIQSLPDLSGENQDTQSRIDATDTSSSAKTDKDPQEGLRQPGQNPGTPTTLIAPIRGI